MLQRTREMNESDNLPIISLVVVADKNKCPPGFHTIVKAHDDGSDADLWRDYGLGAFFNRVVRYLAFSRELPATNLASLEVLTDLAIVSDKAAVPTSFMSIDFTADTKERALRKKYLCARFSPRNTAVDAISDIIVAKTKRPPMGYTLAGDIDGMYIASKASVIPENYGRSSSSQPNMNLPKSLYPGVPAMSNFPNIPASYRHSQSDFSISNGGKRQSGIDRIPFKLNPIVESSLAASKGDSQPYLPDLKSLDTYQYNFNLERTILEQK